MTSLAKRLLPSSVLVARYYIATRLVFESQNPYKKKAAEEAGFRTARCVTGKSKNKCLAFKQVIEWRERNWRKFDQ